jgi:hypothetical protein
MQSKQALLTRTLQEYLRERSPTPRGVGARTDTAHGNNQIARSGRRRARPNTPTVNKTSAIRELLVNYHASGLTASELADALARRRIQISKNAVFAALSKLKRRNLIVTRGGKYVARESLLRSIAAQNTESSSGDAEALRVRRRHGRE